MTPSKSLSQKLAPLVAACCTGILVETCDPKEADDEIQNLCEKMQWRHASWDIDAGFVGIDAEVNTPVKAIKAIANLKNPPDENGNQVPLLVVLPNFHRYLSAPGFELTQTMINQLVRGRQQSIYLIVLSPVTQIPVELEKMFSIVDHPLPDQDQLRQILIDLKKPLPDEKEVEKILDAAAGFTRQQAEDAFSYSWVLNKKFEAESIWEIKADMLRDSSSLRLYRGEVPEIGGLEEMRKFCFQILTNTKAKSKAKGIAILGVSGCGKSAFCKMLGHLTGRPVLMLDVGALMGSLVGQTEAALRKTLKQIDAMGRVIVMIDEVEKMVPSGSHDGGVSSRMEGTLLAWLNDRESEAFVVCTANDISKMRPEFFRAGRFDGLFFVDIPNETVRQQIWDIYIKAYGISDKKIPDVEDWTGAEIFNCCRLADLRGISLDEAAMSTVPIARTACEEIDRLRTWASKRCLDAERPGRYDSKVRKSSGKSRNLLDDPRDPPASAGLVAA
jgi:hypothetical protein